MTKQQLEAALEKHKGFEYFFKGKTLSLEEAKALETGHDSLSPIVIDLLMALEFECGNKCAIGLNPCNAREAIDKALKDLGVER